MHPLPYLLRAALVLLFAGSALGAESPDELMKRGDALDQRLAAGEALNFYLPAEKLEPKNARLLTRIARQYRHLMADAPSNAEKLRLGSIALDYDRRAAAADPSDSDAQLSVAISLGKMLPLLGSKAQVEASPRIKAAADKALELDPRNDLAWHILGRWNRILADVGGVKRALAGVIYGSLPVGSNAEAARCLEKAVAINPNRLIHYVELGRIYAQMGRKDDARGMLKKGLSMPSLEKDDPEAKSQARDVLKQLR